MSKSGLYEYQMSTSGIQVFVFIFFKDYNMYQMSTTDMHINRMSTFSVIRKHISCCLWSECRLPVDSYRLSTSGMQVIFFLFFIF